MFNLLEDTDHPIIQEICFDLDHITSIHSIPHPAGAIVPGGNRTISFLFPAHGHKTATFAPEGTFEQREIILGLLAEYIVPKLGLNGKETLISHIGLMVSDTHTPVLRRSLDVLLFAAHLLLHGTAIHNDPMLSIPGIPWASFTHLAAFICKIIIHSGSVGHTHGRAKHTIELSGGEETSFEGSDPMIFAVGLHTLKGEMVFQENINESVFVSDLILIENKGFMRFCTQGNFLDIITNGRLASTPEAFRCQVVHVVGDPEGIGLYFQAGEDNSQVHHGLSNRCGGINTIFNGDEFNTMILQEGIERYKVGHITAQTVYFINNHHIDEPCKYIILQAVQIRSIHIRTDPTIILIVCDGFNLIRGEMFSYIFITFRKLHLCAV